MNRINKRILALAGTLALVLALAACGAVSSLVSDYDDETGAVKVVAENASDSYVNGYVTVEEGQCLVISPDLTKGSFDVQVTLMEREATAEDLGTAEEPALEENVSGRVMSTYDLEPGEYMLGITAQGKATGTLVIVPYSIQELENENAQLEEVLAEALGQ